MTQQDHLDQFAETVTDAMSQRLVETYRASSRDPALTQVDVVTRLKAVLEEKLVEPEHAPPQTVGQ